MPAESHQLSNWHKDWFNQPCIDLRCADSFAMSHVKETTSLPWDRLENSMHELPDKHQPLQLLGDSEQLHQASAFLDSKGYQVNRTIEASSDFWHWVKANNLGASGCNSLPLWRANPLLERAIDLIETSTTGRSALDFACGAGRDAVYLARRGWNVTAIDIKEDALQRCRALASANEVAISTHQYDMESGENHLTGQSFDLIVVMRYLHRPFLPQLINHLNPNGLLCYSTFMVGSEQFGSPRNPNFLLKPNELAETFPTMKHLINEQDELADGRPVSYFVAQKQP